MGHQEADGGRLPAAVILCTSVTKPQMVLHRITAGGGWPQHQPRHHAETSTSYVMHVNIITQSRSRRSGRLHLQVALCAVKRDYVVGEYIPVTQQGKRYPKGGKGNNYAQKPILKESQIKMHKSNQFC